jgi:hypothetical protein
MKDKLLKIFLITDPLLSPLGQLAVINSLITPVTHLNSPYFLHVDLLY